MITALLTNVTEVTNATSWTGIISSVGFPIFMCLALFYYIQKDGVTNRQRIDNLADALNNNTSVITKLLERLETE